MSLSGLHRVKNFSSELYNNIKNNEGFDVKVYLDSKLRPTIGVGYELISHKNTWREHFKTIKLNVSNEQANDFNNLISALSKIKSKDEGKRIIEKYYNNKNSIKLTNEKEAKELFYTILPDYKKMIIKTSNNPNQGISEEMYKYLKDSKELITLIDLAYNGGKKLIGPGLSKAIEEGDRARAWFEIRYNSNGGKSRKTSGYGIAQRRIRTSDFFGLYPDGNVDEEYHMKVVRMYADYKDKIIGEETSIEEPSENDGKKIGEAYQGTNSFKSQISTTLKHFTNENQISGDIILLDNTHNKLGENTNLNKNDLIIIDGGEHKISDISGNDIYYVRNGKVTIDDKDGKGQVVFNGSTLEGGSYDEDRKAYIDAKDTSITYELKDNNDLIVTKGDSSITIRNFKKSEDGFLNINLKDNPGKEVAIVIDTTGSMGDDIATCKANAKIIASNIFKENFYSKISIVTYNDNDIKTIGTYTDYQGFLGGINSVNLQYGGTEYTMAAILEGMSRFTPNNHLSKEVYVMTDEPGDDNHRRDEVEGRAKIFYVAGLRNANNTNKYEDNSVKINFIAIRDEFEHFKDLAKNTNGMYFNSNSSEELSDALFELSNIGTSSNDVIEGNDKDNSLNGFGGDDTLVGKAGSDTYTFTGLNFGNDTIIESNLNNIDKNTIIFKDVSYKDVRFKKDLNDLKITLNKDNSVTIKDFYNTNNESKISSISFSDVTLDELAIKRSVSMQANKEAIIFLKEKDFSFSNFATSTFAVAYQDNASNISTSYKDDVIIGSNKNDIISTKLGNDTLIGGKGDDKLYGGFGNDIYVYRKGDGNDLIYDDGGQDALKLQNLKADEIFLIKDGKDLLIKFKDDDTNSIRVAHHFAWKFGYHNQINTIELDDNKFINTKTIDKLIEQTSAFAKNNGIDIHNINHINDDRLNQIYMSAWN
ncbi:MULTISPECIES: VWA domain-containing protein [unclassified Campylobacter]|uniref:VWA domain-containing protein n=1 Tax=unclassified Campylobacter TaxID=2593542 RepID=UPI001DEA5600|nr:VWA domain-containing protein [Campylobacter sp. RM9331]MBZ8005808.1 VWA domain-containing protein [Campylobacter sp. RM9332]